MSIEQIIEESADEKNYAEISGRITALNVEIEAAEEKLARYMFENPLRVPDVRERITHLQGQFESLQLQRQRLLPLFADLKSRIHGWG